MVGKVVVKTFRFAPSWYTCLNFSLPFDFSFCWKWVSGNKLTCDMAKYCVKSVQIPSYFLFSPIAGKYGPELTPYLETFRAV